MKLLIFTVLFLLVLPLFGQERSPKRKPVLIRADQTEEEVEKAPPAPDPGKSKEHLEVGDFYLKRDNYKAAENRYREAIQYNPKSPEAYEKLISVLEKQDAFEKALEVCEQFVHTNPASEKIGRFEHRMKKLQQESRKSKPGPG